MTRKSIYIGKSGTGLTMILMMIISLSSIFCIMLLGLYCGPVRNKLFQRKNNLNENGNKYIIKNVQCIDEYGVVLKEYQISLNEEVEPPEIIGYSYVNKDIENGKLFYETKVYEMPIIRIQTKDNKVIDSKEDYTESTITVLNCEESYELENISAGVRLRGNSTAYAAKSPYRIKFDKKTNLLGLNEGQKYKSWVLLADWYDYSLSRNLVEFCLGNELNLYCSDYMQVEVYVNGAYRGVYLLCEQQQINSGRIDIEEYDSETSDELDTGYLLENDYFYYESEDYVIETKINDEVFNYTHWIVKSDTYTDNQLEYITDYMQQVYDAIFKTKSRVDIESLIDINSAIEMNIINLINKDTDSDSSFYVWKDKGGKLIFGAPWDADMSYGNLNGGKDTSGIAVNHLFASLMEMDWYFNLLSIRWNEVSSMLENESLQMLRENENLFVNEYNRNFELYNIWGLKTAGTMVDECLDFRSQRDASEYLQQWLEDRFDWLNEYFTENN